MAGHGNPRSKKAHATDADTGSYNKAVLIVALFTPHNLRHYNNIRRQHYYAQEYYHKCSSVLIKNSYSGIQCK